MKWYQFILLGTLTLTAQANARDLVDRVVAIVDNGVVLESEVNDLVQTVKAGALKEGQSLPSDRALRTQALDRLVMNSIIMQIAERMGVQISDAQLDSTIENIARQDGKTLEAFRQETIDSGLVWEKQREDIRVELITQEVRRSSVRRRIYVTPQEVSNLVEMMESQGDESVEYNIGHILVGFGSGEATQELQEATRERADKVLELLNNGSDFKRIAIASSAGSKALEGGDLGWMNINEMPSLFAEIIRGATTDDIIGPIRSGAGFHIIKIQGVRGEEKVEITEVKSRHILLAPSIILSDENAKKMLNEFLVEIKADETKFDELALKHSEDPGSKQKGGVLDFTDPNVFVPEFRDTLNRLQPGEYSEPFRTTHGWHIVQLMERRVVDSTDKLRTDKAYQMLSQRKFVEENAAWQVEIREQAYVEIFDADDIEDSSNSGE